MQFALRPILSEMKAFYLKPISNNRFQAYLTKLEGDTNGDLDLPIMGYNPMAKDHILQKINELEKLEAELLIKKVIERLNATMENNSSIKINVVLNLADDLKGGWTNRYAADFDSKFKINGLVKRNFCVPYFWTSEFYSEMMIQQRTEDYLNRTLFGLKYEKLKSLEEHLKQEVFVCQKQIKNDTAVIFDESKFDAIKQFYEMHKKSEDYGLIFNFFYGDEISENLAYKKYGIKEKTGFDYAQLLANQVEN